ncbi:MAG: CCA tRNA nucleotidyltransferase [Candidatus Rokubacteria bacterium]|nr:CCA tRNA nucleotidyltransferase [Candidatus Rokubacteria bacterium]
MARHGHPYPQVEPRAADLMDRRVVKAPGSVSVGKALELARAAGAHVVTDRRAATRRKDLERAESWGFGRWRWLDIAHIGLPLVTDGTGEIAVRRLLQGGASAVLVRAGRRAVGIVEPSPRPATSPAASILERLDRLHGSEGEARLWLLRTAGKLGEAQGQAVYAVGGFVRDLLLARAGQPAPDLDLAVEGNGIAFGRRLAEETGGHLVVHAAFGTASLEGGTTPDGARIGRVDIASARRERYGMPGALPDVSPASFDEDLGRRDFSVNAMAVALAPSAWGRLLDPFGGQRDLVARRLRVLHPLSFVEDPTRIFRGARYAARLGLTPDADFRRALSLAWRAGEYPALSGQRLHAELDLVMDEPDPWGVLGLLLGWGALRIWDPGFRVTRRSRGRLSAARSLAAWAHRTGVAVEVGGLALAALLFDQPRPTAERCLRRLAVASVDAARLDPAAARSLARRVGAQASLRPSRVAEMLRPAPEATLLGAWLCGGHRARGRIEWFLGQGRGARPLSSGDDVVAAGVPRGPRVARVLALLRDLRLDGRVRTKDDESAAVADWVEALTRKGETR